MPLLCYWRLVHSISETTVQKLDIPLSACRKYEVMRSLSFTNHGSLPKTVSLPTWIIEQRVQIPGEAWVYAWIAMNVVGDIVGDVEQVKKMMEMDEKMVEKSKGEGKSEDVNKDESKNKTEDEIEDETETKTKNESGHDVSEL